MRAQFLAKVDQELRSIREDGLFKVEREITSAQSHWVAMEQSPGKKILNLCANNYLGLADNPELAETAKRAMDDHGLGMASVRFICGTQDLHRKLERRLAEFLEKDDAILFASCFDANGALFEPLLGPDDAVISDSLNHASIIDGIRLCKAKRYRYANGDMADLEYRLKEADKAGARYKLIATDGVFSMDGIIAPLPEIAKLAQQYGALVMVDDCHATGFTGPKGKGTPALFGLGNEIDILSGTLGKALGGTIGGYIAGPQPVVDLLRQRARPYLFSNSIPPSMVAAAIRAIDLIEAGDDLRAQLEENTLFWREGLSRAGFTLSGTSHPIVPVMLGDAKLSQKMAGELFERGIHVAGFFYPVVPKGKARIRTQMNASLTRDDLEFALDAFKAVAKKLELI